MKAWKVILAVVVVLVVVGEFSQATARGGRGLATGFFGVSIPLTPEQLLELKKHNCAHFSKDGFNRTSLFHWMNKEADSMGNYYELGSAIPFVRVKKIELLPEELRKFIETTLSKLPNCKEFHVFWQAPESKVLFWRLFGDPAEPLDEKSAYRVRLRVFYCEEYQLYDKDLSEISPFPFVSELWHEFPLLTFFLAFVLAVFVLIGIVALRVWTEISGK